ncbi:tryptophan 2-3-dioxygenase, partial [Brachionus plicatilis]
DFRGYLSTASGFQSVQFRLFENKLGLSENLRIKFNQQKYDYLFTDSETKEKIRKSVEEPSLLKLINAWLERTPGLVTCEQTENGSKEYNYLLKEYEKSVNEYLEDTYVKAAQEETNEDDRKSLMDEYKKTLDAFATIFDKEKHDKLVERGERKLSHQALWGALMIWLNRDEPRFHLPYQMLSLLTDLDAFMNRWRYNHALLAQRQVGNKSGTGGSSGYSYLRSTASDRYKIFNDIVNLSTWLIPREYLPTLNEDLKKRLNTFE